jgi:hypothetical protein
MIPLHVKDLCTDRRLTFKHRLVLIFMALESSWLSREAIHRALTAAPTFDNTQRVINELFERGLIERRVVDRQTKRREYRIKGAANG